MQIKSGMGIAISSSLLLMLFVSSSVSQDLVISEVDYDQVGVDRFEWIEILNLLDIEVPTDQLYLVLYDGATDGTCEEYCRVDLSLLNIIPEGSSIVIGAHPCAILPLCSTTDGIQNGVPDAIVLEYLGQPYDSVEYGSDLINSVCGLSQTVAIDSDTAPGSIGLCHGGSWVFSENPTPCEPNACTVSDVPELRAAIQTEWHVVKRLYWE